MEKKDAVTGGSMMKKDMIANLLAIIAGTLALINAWKAVTGGTTPWATAVILLCVVFAYWLIMAL